MMSRGLPQLSDAIVDPREGGHFENPREVRWMRLVNRNFRTRIREWMEMIS